MIVQCIDNLFRTSVLVEGWEYEVRAERDDCYILFGFDMVQVGPHLIDAFRR
jgi:hypothetical protein